MSHVRLAQRANAGANSGQITFQADSDTFSTPAIFAVNDSLNEGIERFKVNISTSASATPDYVTVDQSVDDQGFTASRPSQEYFVLEGTTLFAWHNNENQFADGTPAANGGNPGIHINDINQGGIGDCYLLAALGTLTQTNWQLIQNNIALTADGSGYSVTFYRQDENNRIVQESRTVSGSELELDLGNNAASLSGDYDQASGAVEIWPYIYERAFAKYRGGESTIANGGVVHDAWTALTGESGSWQDLEGSTNSEVVAALNNALSNGGRVVINTAVESDLSNGVHIYAPHAYTLTGRVTAIDANGTESITAFSLFNPHGGADAAFDVPIGEIHNVVGSISILSP